MKITVQLVPQFSVGSVSDKPCLNASNCSKGHMGHGQLIYNGSSNYKLLDFTQKKNRRRSKVKGRSRKGGCSPKAGVPEDNLRAGHAPTGEIAPHQV